MDKSRSGLHFSPVSFEKPIFCANWEKSRRRKTKNEEPAVATEQNIALESTKATYQTLKGIKYRKRATRKGKITKNKSHLT